MSAPFPPPSRALDMSPVSNAGSEWSGVNSYNPTARSDSPFNPYNRGDSGGPLDSRYSNEPPSNKSNGFGPPPPPPPPPSDHFQDRRPSESGSRDSSRAVSMTNSRSSNGTISEQQRGYRRIEAELSQHYAVLKAYLRGGSQQPPRPNKARDKLLRLSPVQFHELSTDVFDELQRRQASAPLPGRPPRRENVPPFLQPRSDFHEKRNQARQKLSTLQTPRFRDLSTDVFCELERRFPHFSRSDGERRDSSRSQSRGPNGRAPMGNPYPPGPPGPNGFGGPPRGHSQNRSQGQSISSSAGFPPRNGSVSQFETGPIGTDYGRPMPKQFQSNTITPNKSTMVEDEDDGQGTESRYDRSSDAFGLESSLTSPRSDRDTSATSQSIASSGLGGKNGHPKINELQDKVGDLEAALESKEQELRRLRNRSKSDDQWSSVKQDLERKLNEAERFNQSLKEEIERVKTENGEVEELRSQLEATRLQPSDDGMWRSKHDQLEREHYLLQEKLERQRDVTDEVRRQGQMYLEEMRTMAESGGGNFEREEKLQTDVQKLEEEVKEWKARYVKAKTQLRSVRASSLGLSIAKQDVSRYARDETYNDTKGLVKDVHVTKFQISIDELLRISRSEDPAAVLEHMKGVVMAVRNITTDIDAAPSSGKDDEMAKKRSKLKGKVSATANNLITASKNFAAAGGLSPVSLVDAAASHLTAAVVDLVRTVKIRPTPAGELDDDDDGTLEPLQNNGYFNIAESLRRRSAVESVYSALSSPRDDGNGRPGLGPSMHRRSASNHANGNGLGPGLGIQSGFGLRQEESDLEELKIYIENQSDRLVESIQVLIEAIRGQEPLTNIRNHISEIAEAVDNVVNATEGAAQDPSSYQHIWSEQTASVTSVLQQCNNKLLQASDESEAYDGQPSAKDFMQTLPPLAFQIAKETRDLLRRIQGIRADAGMDDFS